MRANMREERREKWATTEKNHGNISEKGESKKEENIGEEGKGKATQKREEKKKPKGK